MLIFIVWILTVVAWSAFVGLSSGFLFSCAYNFIAQAFGIPEVPFLAFVCLVSACVFLKNIIVVNIKPGETNIKK